MRRFFFHIALFALPFIGLGAYIWLKEQPREVAYNAVQKDCRTGDWVYKRLFEVETPVDVAFVGTSKTMCGIDDRLLERRLLEEKGVEVHVANLGLCRIGENLHYLLVRDLLEQKQPRLLFVEAPQRLLAASHPHFPYLARDLGDVLGAPMTINGDYFSDLAEFAWWRWTSERNAWLGHYEDYSTFLEDERHSFMEVANDQVADPATLENDWNRRRYRAEQPPAGFLQGIGYFLDQYPPQTYLRRMADLAEERGTKLVFLYTPAYGAANKMPREQGFYRETASLALPPDSVFNRQDFFFDPDHLNQRGAASLTDWLMEVVEENLGN